MDFNNYIFSKAAASRIYGKEAKAVTVERDRAIITFTDGTVETTTTAKFKQHFAEHRREQGKALSPMLDPTDDSVWHVSKYRVTVHPDRLTCTCHDWKSQSAIGISRPTCKHCYAVLYKMGYGKLSEYLEAKGSATATNQKSDSPSPTSSSVPQLPSLPQWVLNWESYGRDRAGNPLETATTKLNRRPTDSEVWELRKNAHTKGYKLASLEQVKQTA